MYFSADYLHYYYYYYFYYYYMYKLLTSQCTAYFGNLAMPVWRWEGKVEDWPVALLLLG